MNRLRPKGTRRAFPYALNPDDSYNEKLKNLFKVHRDEKWKIVGFDECK